MNDLQTINVLKGLVIDGVNKAQSGHPGGAMSSMDFAYLLFTEFLNYSPDDPRWLGRDRFILSAGHESMLIYSLLHMQGFLGMDELKRFRQLHSKTPGHPENYLTPGIECTTGPLGQGVAMSVGFAIAAKHLAATQDSELFNYKIWALMGDGCVQEGVTLAAASTAGHFKLNNLIWFYDRNRVQISGRIDRSVSDDHKKVFEGSGWHVVEVDGHDHSKLRAVMEEARSGKHKKPFLIIGDTTMARGTFSMEGSAKTHGSPLPADERLKTKEKLGLPTDQDFYCPNEAVQHFRRNWDGLRKKVAGWNQRFETKLAHDSKFKSFYDQAFNPNASYSHLPPMEWPRDKAVATRNAFGDIIEKWADHLPQLIGGSADLEPSNMTGAFAKKVGDFGGETPQNRNISFGVREFPMSAIANGIALHGGLIPFDATFLSFADYSRPALRLGAIQKVRVIHEFTHDSFQLGEDGPTHQPVEHLMSLRVIPNFYVMRPADAFETEMMFRTALTLQAPSAICLSRQNLPILPLTREQVAQSARGAYTISGPEDATMTLMATGGEVSLAMEVAKRITDRTVKVVSMPCWELFEVQDASYRHRVINPNCPQLVSIEAGSTLGWQKYTGARGLNIGLDHFGDSAPAKDLEKEYGFTPDQVTERIRQHFG